MTDEELMRIALAQAKEAAALGEVPVGAVVAKDGQVVAAAHNTRETRKNATHHAELLAIDAACRALGGWRLWQCELYVTARAVPDVRRRNHQRAIPRIYFGASDPKAGSCGSVIDLFSLPYNHKPEVVRGVMQEECAAVLKNFFRRLREAKASKRGPES